MATQPKKRAKKNSTLSVLNVTKGGQVVVIDSVEKFTQEFLKNGGKVTEAAQKVGNFTTLHSAAQSGSRWLAKAKQRGLIRNALEKRGYGYGKLIDVAVRKMEASKKPDWWDRIMKMADYDDFITTNKDAASTNIQTMNIFAAHRKLSEDYIDGEMEEVEDEQITKD